MNSLRASTFLSILDMFAILYQFTDIRADLLPLKYQVMRVMEAGAAQRMSPEFIKIATDELWRFRRYLDQHGFPRCVSTIDRTIRLDREGQPGWLQPDMAAALIYARLHELEENFILEAAECLLMVVGADKKQFNARDFGPVIREAFPSASREIREAHFCLMLERHTACVFHLMRAAEYGLRAYARSLGVKVSDLEMEHKQWGQILELAEAAGNDFIKNITPKGKPTNRPATEAARVFIKPLLADFVSFKDEIRNIVFHTRKGGTYDEAGALSVRNRVLHCFTVLATHVREDGKRLKKSVFR